MTPPDLILFTAFGGDWARYENELYDIFINEIARGGLTFRDARVNCRRSPETAGPKLNSMFDKMTLYQCVVRGRTSVTTTFCG